MASFFRRACALVGEAAEGGDPVKRKTRQSGDGTGEALDARKVAYRDAAAVHAGIEINLNVDDDARFRRGSRQPHRRGFVVAIYRHANVAACHGGNASPL